MALEALLTVKLDIHWRWRKSFLSPSHNVDAFSIYSDRAGSYETSVLSTYQMRRLKSVVTAVEIKMFSQQYWFTFSDREWI